MSTSCECRRAACDFCNPPRLPRRVIGYAKDGREIVQLSKHTLTLPRRPPSPPASTPAVAPKRARTHRATVGNESVTTGRTVAAIGNVGDTLTFTIPGNPIPKERARVVRTRRGKSRGVTPATTRAYEALVWLHATKARGQFLRAHGTPWPADGRYAVTLTVVRSTLHACDLSNIGKAIEDGAESKYAIVMRRKVRTAIGLWNDDAQIDDLHVVRGGVDAASPGVLVTVRRLAADPVQSKGRAVVQRIGAGR